ncbi:MAG: ATP-dependent Clp protease adapter ClpS [Gammaproteobacteria bacterium]|nr:ATP-dependent Clp protease adapter ClpS [Gammaproteobacteria bacterium]MDD9814753.1 ATP-dependent Clp protease adapter ClpS [Gammaproteobacteria bacterium]MDD9851207.1 ATP-dependent Clp protease adapter ClpS [Gammaproteobacteria bacterium]
MSDYDPHQQQRGGMALVVPRTRARRRVQKPRLYKVVLLNDDFTPMEFVVMVLMEIFFHPQEEAVQIMLHVHRKGAGVCGVYPSEIAETKVRQVNNLTRKHQHPLRCVMEPE